MNIHLRVHRTRVKITTDVYPDALWAGPCLEDTLQHLADLLPSDRTFRLGRKALVGDVVNNVPSAEWNATFGTVIKKLMQGQD